MNNFKYAEGVPIVLLKYMTYENEEWIASDNMPFYLKPKFNRFKKRFDSRKDDGIFEENPFFDFKFKKNRNK